MRAEGGCEWNSFRTLFRLLQQRDPGCPRMVVRHSGGQGRAMKWLWLAALVVALDQTTKFVAVGNLDLYQSIPLFPFFNLTLVHNYGAAFSFLNNAGGWQRWLFSGFALVVSVAIILWLPRLREARWHLPLALSLILGGTLGNLVDRLVLGYVVDFLDFHAVGLHWPAFNIADSAITIGALALVVDAFRNRSDEQVDRC